MKIPVWLIAITSFFVASHSASACSCKVSDLSQNIERADVILVAEISSVTRENITVLPIEIFKGKIKPPVVFRNDTVGTGCNYFGFHGAHVGDRLLVFYTNPLKGQLFLTSCSSSGSIERRGAELAALRQQFKNNSASGDPKTALH